MKMVAKVSTLTIAAIIMALLSSACDNQQQATKQTSSQPDATAGKSAQGETMTAAFDQSKYWDGLRSLPFPENYPTKETADQLYDEMLFHRATQVVLWSLPATALWAMKKGSEA